MSQQPINKDVQEVVENAQQEVAASQKPWYYLSRTARILLAIYAVQLTLFGVLACWVHFNPVLPVDVAITREFQENPSPWLNSTMWVVSYPGNSLLLPLLVVLTSAFFWLVRLRLEAVMILTLSIISTLLNGLLKLIVSRPRPNASLVEIFQVAAGKSFPSGHVMAYLAFFGLLFSLGIILFRGTAWWRILLLVVSALFVVLVGPSRIYLGDHWASDVLGSYLIGGVLLGITLWLYLQLKRRGLLEPASMRTRASKLFRSFSSR